MTRQPSVKHKLRVVATSPAYGRWCRQSLGKLPAALRRHIDVRELPGARALALPRQGAADTVVVGRLADVPPRGAVKPPPGGGNSKHLLFNSGLSAEAVLDRLSQFDIRNRQRIYVAEQRPARGVVELVSRLLSGMVQTEGPRPIVDAWVEHDELVLLSPQFERLKAPLSRLAPLLGADPRLASQFELDEDGRFLYWPHADVHLGWEQLLAIVNPQAAGAAIHRAERFQRRYGQAIRAFRERAGLRQTDVPGVTERHLRRVEHGTQAVTSHVLRALAEAHQLTLDGYLKELAALL